MAVEIIEIARKHNQEMIRLHEKYILETLRGLEASIGLIPVMVHMVQDENGRPESVKIDVTAPKEAPNED